MIGVLFVFTACQRHSDMQDEGASFLQGVWIQDSLPHQDRLLNYTLHELKFVCDSLYTIMHVHATTKTIPDSCFKEGQWTEYAKAVYVVRGDSLIAEGVYTRDNWKQRISGCYKQGQYLPRFKIVHYSADTLVLQNRFDSVPMTLRKTADIDCVPKKRWEM